MSVIDRLAELTRKYEVDNESGPKVGAQQLILEAEEQSVLRADYTAPGVVQRLTDFENNERMRR